MLFKRVNGKCQMKELRVMKKLFLLILLFAITATVSAGFDVGFNDQLLDGKTHLEIAIGKSNAFGVNFADKGDYKLVVTINSPDESSVTKQQKFSNNNPAKIEVGPLAILPVFVYDAGSLMARTYRFDVAVFQGYRKLQSWALTQKITPKAGWKLEYTNEPLIEYNGGWTHRRSLITSAAIYPFNMRFGYKLLFDQNDMEVQYTIADGSKTWVVFTDENGKEMFKSAPLPFKSERKQVFPKSRTMPEEDEFRRFHPKYSGGITPDVSNWPLGKYYATMWIEVDGQKFKGPQVRYLRKPAEDPLNLRVDPYTPLRLKKDPKRKELLMDNMKKAFDAYGAGSINTDDWAIGDKPNNLGGLISKNNSNTNPVKYNPKLKGYYAIYAKPAGGGIVQVGGAGVIRQVLHPYCPSDDYVFIEASDLTGKNINVYALGNSELDKKYKNYYNGTLGLKFIPVTKESVEDFYRLTYNPPTKMNSISDQICLFGNPTRAEPDQVAAGIVGPAATSTTL